MSTETYMLEVTHDEAAQLLAVLLSDVRQSEINVMKSTLAGSVADEAFWSGQVAADHALRARIHDILQARVTVAPALTVAAPGVPFRGQAA